MYVTLHVCSCRIIIYKKKKKKKKPDGNCRDGTRVQETATQKKTTKKPCAYIRAEGPSENYVEEEESSDPSDIALPEILKEQRNDPKLSDIIKYIELEKLPEEQQRSKHLVLERPRFDLVDGVLYFCDLRPPYRMRLAMHTREAQTSLIG